MTLVGLVPDGREGPDHGLEKALRGQDEKAVVRDLRRAGAK
ncbi:hypothetical protein ACF1B0_12000 [Streptomyces anandii]